MIISNLDRKFPLSHQFLSSLHVLCFYLFGPLLYFYYFEKYMAVRRRKDERLLKLKMQYDWPNGEENGKRLEVILFHFVCITYVS